MKTSPKDLFRGRKYAKFITSHPIFDKIDKINKVFPGIGLPNCEDAKVVDNATVASKSAKVLLSAIEYNLAKRSAGLVSFSEKHPKMGAERKTKLDNLIKTINATFDTLKEDESKCILVDKDCVKLKLPIDITINGEKKPVFRADMSIIRAYGKINELLAAGKFARMKQIDNEPTFKEFSKDNLPNAGLKVVFSSDGADGVWDIATMSMRGVSSCQSWGNGAYKNGVIGSMIDPFVGIIYLTTGGKFNDYGSKMIKRCIVRYVVDAKTKKPFLALDNMYPSFDNNVLTQFIEFLQSRVDKKIDVHYASHLYGKQVYQSSYIPLTKVRESLEKFGVDDPYRETGGITAYQDVKFSNKKPIIDVKEHLFEKNSAKKANKFTEHLITAANEALKIVDVDIFPEAIQPAIQSLKGVGIKKGFYNCGYRFPEIMTMVAKEFIASVDTNNFTNSDTYVRRIYYDYFNRKEQIFSGMKNKLVKKINDDLMLPKKNRLRPDHLMVMMQIILSQTDAVMKDNLRKLVSKRKHYAPSPLPDATTK